jgi:hypothetical protein
MIVSLLFVACSRPISSNGPLLPSSTMPLTTVETPMFTTGVPTGWTVRIMGVRMLEAYDPGTRSETQTANLHFELRGGSEACGGEKLTTNEGPSCLTTRTSSGENAAGNIVELQTPGRVIRLTHSVGELDKPVSIEELRGLAIRIVNTYAPAAAVKNVPKAEAPAAER